MAAAQLPRPGVQVIQQFRAQSPTIITPQLVPCVVGVCKQIVELLQDDGAGGQIINPDALIQLPAFFISKNASGDPPVFTGLDGLRLSVSINNAPAVQVTFSDPSASGLTPATIVSQINDAYASLGVSSARAVLLDEERFKYTSVGLGQFQSIYIDPVLTDPAVADAFGVGPGQTYSGLSDFNNREVVIPPEAFPDPRGNLSQLIFEQDSIRLFLSTGSGVGVFEARRDESFLRNGVVDLPAEISSTVNPGNTYPGDFYGLTFIAVVGGEEHTYTFPTTGASPANADEVASMLTSGIPGLLVEHDTGTLSFSTTDLGANSSLVLRSSSTSLPLLGLVDGATASGTSVASVDDGNGDATTPIIEFEGEDFTLSATNGELVASTAPNFSGLAAGETLVLSDGQQTQEIVFSGSEATVTGAADSLQATIEAIVGPAAGGRLEVSEGGSGELVITNTQRFGDESLVRIIGGTALTALDEGTEPAVTAEGAQSTAPNTSAITDEGSVELSAVQGSTAGETFDISVDGGLSQIVDLGAAGVDHTDVATLVTHIDGQIVGATASLGLGGGLVVTSDAAGSLSTLEISEGTGGAALLGLPTATFTGENVFPVIGTETFTVQLDENTDAPPAPVQVTLASETDFATLKTNIEAQLTGVTVTQGSTNSGLVFTGTTTGVAGTIRFVNDGGGGLAALGLSAALYFGGGETIAAGAEARGRAHPPLPGDDVYVDGLFFATINQVAPGGNANRLKVDRQVVISSNVGSRFFIQAKDLSPSDMNTARPTADLALDLSNNATVKHSLMRDFAGDPVDTRAPLYLSYSAVRLDTTSAADDPGLLRFDDTIQLEQAIGPISADNPLALGLFFSLVNAPGIQVTGLGVDAISADSPDGTVEAFTRAAEYLEAFEVYAIAPLTHDESVGQVFNTHVSFMSEPEQRGERVVMWNPRRPTNALDTLVGSGTNGDALTTLTFDTKIVNLSALLQNAGVSPIGTIPVDEGVFLDIASDSLRYSVKSVSGSKITVRVAATEFPLGSNDDDFYAEQDLPLPLIGELFSIRVRGRALVTIDGKPDKNAIAETVNQLGASFGNRRFWMTFPEKCRASIGGLEQLIEGYYMNAATVGAIGQQPPQQSFTNFPIAGFTGVVGSNDTFSEAQLDVMAGGGTYIFIQEGQGTPIFSRFALTTDLTSIETRTDSVNKVVDFTAKFMRSSLRNFIGRFNITQGFLDTLSTTAQGLFGFLVETGVLIGGQLDNIIQDEDQRDTVLIDTTLDVPIPCNYIKLTLLI